MSVRGGIINAQMDMNDIRLRVRLDRIPTELRKGLYEAIGRLTKELAGKVRARQPRRSGLLRRQTHAYVDDNKIKNFVRGRVRVLNAHDKNIAAAFGALEYGSTGKFYEVRGYSRRGVHVDPYLRRGRLQARHYLRRPAAAMLPKARAEIARVLDKVISET